MKQVFSIIIASVCTLGVFAQSKKYKVAPVSKTVKDVVLPTVSIDDFKEPGDNDYLNAWNKAKAALPNGGTILFAAKTYSINSNAATNNGVGWFLEKDNITLQGAGRGKTVLTAGTSITCTMSNQTRLFMPFVRGYLAVDTPYVYTYKNSLKKNDRYIILKDTAFAPGIARGNKMMLTGGSHYYDQEFGELVTVTGKNKDTIFLKDPLSGSYAIDSVPFASTLVNDFVMPPVGGLVTVKLEFNGKSFIPNVTGRFYNIGDNIFLLTSFTESTATFQNIGKGNAPAGTVVTAGTHAMKGRTILTWDHTKNLKIKDLTVYVKNPRGLRLDNTYGGEINNVNVIIDSTVVGPMAYSTDFCRDVRFTNVNFESKGAYATSQVSRSAGDISFSKCTFTKVVTDLSEYCFNVRIDSCTFNVARNKTLVQGGTVRKSYITNNTFNTIDTVNSMINTGEIQSLTNVQREYALIAGNTFNCTYFTGAIFDAINGVTEIINNKVYGNINVVSTSFNRPFQSASLYPTFIRFSNNYIEANIRLCAFYGGIYNGIMNDNKIVNTKPTPAPFFLNYNSSHSGIIRNNFMKNFQPPVMQVSGVVLSNNTVK